MYGAKADGDSVLVSLSTGGSPVHRRMTPEDAQDFKDQLEEAIEEVSN